MIYPTESPAPLAHADMPEDCAAICNEARSIVNASPRATVALLRLCVQTLMPHLGEPGKHINTDIKSLVEKGLPTQLQKALDICRVVGNNGVHPGEIRLDEDPQITINLFNLVNLIVDNQIAEPKRIEAMYSQLPKGAIEAVQKRDGQQAGNSS